MASTPNVQLRRRKKPHQDIADLPHNKDYHLFVCYCRENREEVTTIVANLAAYGVKCCFHDRDFIPGQWIIDNMHEGIRKSVGILIVLSETFVSSKYCKFEIKEALHTHIEEGYQVIPIKIEPCDVPCELRHVSFIDATEDEIGDVHVKIIKTIIKTELQEEEKRKNGICALFPVKGYKISKFSFTRYRLQIGQKELTELLEEGFEVSSELLSTAEDIVSRSPIVKYHYVLNNLLLMLNIFASIVLLLIMQVFMVVLLSTSSTTISEKITPAGLVLSICVPVLFVIWMLALCWARYLRCISEKGWIMRFLKQERLKLNNDLWDNVTNRLGKKTKTFVFYNMFNLVVMRLNLKPCKDVFLRKLRNRTDVAVKENYMDYTNRVFDYFLRNEIHLLAVPNTQAKRHNMATGSACPCLLVEDRILNK